MTVKLRSGEIVLRSHFSSNSDKRTGDTGNHRFYQRRVASKVWPVPHGLPAQHPTFVRLMGVLMITLVTTARPPVHVVVMELGPVGYLAAQTS